MTIPGDHRRGRHAVSALHVHLVFVTKYRRGVLDADMLRSCQDAMRKVCDEFGAELRDFNGGTTMCTCSLSTRRRWLLSALVNSFKGVPARRLRAEFTGRVNRHIMHGHYWSPS
jgi:putative transposase